MTPEKIIPEKLVVATDNQGKLAEFQRMLGDTFELIPQSQFGIEAVEETGKTFRENALLKARHAARISGLRAIADDSGLEVDALDGAPGVRSSRYAGEQASDIENLEKLLDEMADIPDSDRGARFRCVLVVVSPEEDQHWAEGVWEGLISTSPQGTGGFGYDPVFIDRESGRAAAELTAAEKNQRSHRGMAVRALVAAISSVVRTSEQSAS